MAIENWQGTPVLVTGAAGFLGARLTEVLLSRGAKVTGWDCVESPARLRDVSGQIEYAKIDIADTEGVLKKSQPFQAIFHLAAFAMPAQAQKQPDLAYRQNVLGTVNMLNLARQCAVKKFVFLSAGALYTNIPKYLPIDEKHPIDPQQSIYAATKRMGELLCEDFQKIYNVPCIYFRLFNTYGPRQSEEYLIPSFIKQAGSGQDLSVWDESIKRDFTYVDDTVDALIRGGQSSHQGGPINIGSGVENTIGDVARKIASFFNVKVTNLNKEVFGPKRQLCGNTLAKTVLGWQPKYSLEQGLELTVRAVSSNHKNT